MPHKFLIGINFFEAEVWHGVCIRQSALFAVVHAALQPIGEFAFMKKRLLSALNAKTNADKIYRVDRP